MQQLNKRLILSLAALLVVCGVSLSGGTVLAEHGSNSGSGGGGSDSSNDTAEVATSSTTDTNNEQETEHSKTLRDQFRDQAKVKVQADRKEKAQTKTAEQRQKSCTARKANLTKRMTNSVAAAQRHKEVFDKTRESIKAYRKSLVELITQLHGASTSTDKTKDSSTNSTTE
jgi:hypothetical protein